MNTTEEEEFDYQAYMKDYAPDPEKIYHGPEARQKRRKAAIHNNRGVTYANEGDYDQAIDDFDKAIKLNPSYAIAYNNRGATYRDKGEVDCAIEDCSKAIELKPDYADSYNNRGAAYRDKGEIDRAIEDYTKTIELEPNFVEAYYNRGFAYGEKGNYDRAIIDYTNAIELKRDLVDAYAGRGMAYYRKADFHRAIKDFNLVIDLNPNFVAKVYCNRGEAWLHLGKWDKARLDLTVAVAVGINIINVFHNDYESVLDFEEKNGVKLPADIAAMLTPQQ